MSRKIFRTKGNLCGFLVVFHRDLAIAETETVPDNGGINSLLAYVKNNLGKRAADRGRLSCDVERGAGIAKYGLLKWEKRTSKEKVAPTVGTTSKIVIKPIIQIS